MRPLSTVAQLCVSFGHCAFICSVFTSVHSMYDGVFEWQTCLRLEGAVRDLAMSDS